MADEHIEYPWPDESTEEERHHMLLGGENELLSEYTGLAQATKTEGARRHASAGVCRRLLILQHCRMWLRDECAKHTATVSPYVATELSIYVNAYYVNLCGALDNLAWELVHELGLAASVNEDDRKIQALASLTNKAFGVALEGAHPRIAARVTKTLDWHRDVRKLRDPAAHRLPLTVIAGILNEIDHAEAQRLQQQASEEIKQGNIDKYFELLFQASRLGKFRPWLENPEGYQKGFFYIPNLVARDQAFFVDLAGAIGAMLGEDLGTRNVLASLHQRPKPPQPWDVGAYLRPHAPYRLPEFLR
jgi:hypothetical protein